MAPNPIMLPRRRPHNPKEQAALGLTWPIIATSWTVLLVAISHWARRWLLSGCAVESLLILYAAGAGFRVFPSIPLWTLLTSINLVYAIASTSWLFYGFFTAACWPFVLMTCLFQFESIGDFTRKQLRKTLLGLYFTRDRIALFNLPALEIDTEVSGLMVIRGVTISLSNLTIIAHGIEIGIKLADEIELALYVDEVRVPLFRRIEVGDVYGNVKGGKAEMTFADVEEDGEGDDEAFFNDTPLLRAATAGSEGMRDRPTLRESQINGGASYIKDSSAQAGFDNVKTLSPDGRIAEQQYHAMVTEIRTTSAIYQSRIRVRQAAQKQSLNLENEKDMRAAICAELHEVPSIPHPPPRSVKVTTLQNLTPPTVRRYLHRVPFLLRLLLGPLGYFHPLSIESINAAGSGQWVKELLQQQVFKDHADNSAEVRRLQRRISTWLADANFCLQLTDIDGLGQVPLSTSFDIVAYLHFADIMAYRTLPQSGILKQVVRLGGADATFTIPSYLLPHHEHILPPFPTAEVKQEMEDKVEEADGIPKTVQAEQEKERVVKDEAHITMSVHASLPAAFDQSLLLFIAALVKATKIIEFDKEVDRVDPERDVEEASITRTATQMSNESVDSTITPMQHRASTDLSGISIDTASTTTTGSKNRLKAFTKNLQQNLKEVSASAASAVSKEGIKDFVRDVQHSTAHGVKKTIVGSMVNDRWIAKLVGKVAANLERAQGDVGYSGAIPVSLEEYRPQPGGDGNLSKFLP